MQVIDGEQKYPLYAAHDISTRYKKFYDLGLVAFLSCLGEIVDYLKSLERNYNLPYK